MATARFLVSGRVQGVFYRASTRTEALRLGLVGVARNLPGGEVEIMASGSSHAIDALEKWLWHGPPSARVEHVTRTDIAEQAFDGFAIG